MTNVQSRPVDIYKRIDTFVVQVLFFLKQVPRTLENIEILKQVIRSTCSIGANANEADGTLTRNEFLHSFSIARREAKETLYWLKLLSKLNPQLSQKIAELISEDEQLVAILSKIIQTSRNNQK